MEVAHIQQLHQESSLAHIHQFPDLMLGQGGQLLAAYELHHKDSPAHRTLTPFKLAGQWCMHTTASEKDISCYQVLRGPDRAIQGRSCQSFVNRHAAELCLREPAKGTPQSDITPGCLLHESMAKRAAM